MISTKRKIGEEFYFIFHSEVIYVKLIGYLHYLDIDYNRYYSPILIFNTYDTIYEALNIIDANSLIVMKVMKSFNRPNIKYKTQNIIDINKKEYNDILSK